MHRQRNPSWFRPRALELSDRLVSSRPCPPPARQTSPFHLHCSNGDVSEQRIIKEIPEVD